MVYPFRRTVYDTRAWCIITFSEVSGSRMGVARSTARNCHINVLAITKNLRPERGFAVRRVDPKLISLVCLDLTVSG